MHPSAPANHAQSLRAMIQSLAGDVDPAGVELVRLVKMVAHGYEAAIDAHLVPAGLSGPRWGLLMRLLAEEQWGGSDGASPTRLSHHQNVSKNTISALLRGLEEQGLIARALDPDDRRAFRIRLTEAGRTLVQSTAPAHIAYLNALAAGLTAKERQQLTMLLGKLYQSLTTERVTSND